MKHITLTQGKFALVDDRDFDWLSHWKWYAQKHGNSFYTVRNAWVGIKKTTIQMHRVILNASEGTEVDHINHDTLDNRRENLRVCTRSQNNMNRGVYSNNELGVKGVSHNGSGFCAVVYIGGKRVYYKTFRTLEEAQEAYDREAKKHHGDYFHS